MNENLKKLAQFKGSVTSKTFLRKLPNIAKGEIYWVELDNMAYVVTQKEGDLVELKPLDEYASISTGLTVYDISKKVAEQTPPFDWEDDKSLWKFTDDLKNFFLGHPDSKFFLLYGRNMHYFTLLWRPTQVVDLPSVSQVIRAAGETILFEFEKDKVEIWVKTASGEVELLYLFPFDNGVVEV